MNRIVTTSILLVLAGATLASTVQSAPAGSWYYKNAAWAPGGKDSDFSLQMAAPNTYAYAALVLPAHFRVEDVTAFSMDSYYIEGTCGGGSPRAQLRVDVNDNKVLDAADKNIFVYGGAAPSFNGCTQGVWYSDNLLDGAKRWDTTQIGGTFYDTQVGAIAKASGHDVLAAVFVWDSAWMTPLYSLRMDNLRVNGFLLGEPAVGDACSLVYGQTGASCP